MRWYNDLGEGSPDSPLGRHYRGLNPPPTAGLRANSPLDGDRDAAGAILHHPHVMILVTPRVTSLDSDRTGSPRTTSYPLPHSGIEDH